MRNLKRFYTEPLSPTKNPLVIAVRAVALAVFMIAGIVWHILKSVAPFLIGIVVLALALLLLREVAGFIFHGLGGR